MTKCPEASPYPDGDCRGCGAALQLTGLQWCGICRQKRVHEGLEALPYDEAMSDKRHRWRRDGRCRECGGDPLPGRQWCEPCRRKRADERRARRIRWHRGTHKGIAAPTWGYRYKLAAERERVLAARAAGFRPGEAYYWAAAGFRGYAAAEHYWAGDWVTTRYGRHVGWLRHLGHYADHGSPTDMEGDAAVRSAGMNRTYGCLEDAREHAHALGLAINIDGLGKPPAHPRRRDGR